MAFRDKWDSCPAYKYLSGRMVELLEENDFWAIAVLLQFCKNIVLAGVGSLTLNDDRPVTSELLSADFLIPPDETVYCEKSLAELCCDSLKDFNPMVGVSVQKEIG